jgi:hypothetical protein
MCPILPNWHNRGSTGLTFWKTPRRKAPLEEVNIPYTVMKFPAFYKTLRFISVFITASHWMIFWARRIQLIPLDSICTVFRFNIIFLHKQAGCLGVSYLLVYSLLEKVTGTSQSRNSPHFMESEGSLQRLQEPATFPSPGPEHFNPCLPHPTSWIYW